MGPRGTFTGTQGPIEDLGEPTGVQAVLWEPIENLREPMGDPIGDLGEPI